MKVSELESAMLDYWVCRAEGWARHNESGELVWRLPPTPDDELGELAADANYTPSTDWSQGGPIIQREKIELRHFNDGWCANIKNQPSRHFYGTIYSTFASGEKINTPLIAAMRAFVASKLGDNVPDEVAG